MLPLIDPAFALRWHGVQVKCDGQTDSQIRRLRPRVSMGWRFILVFCVYNDTRPLALRRRGPPRRRAAV